MSANRTAVPTTTSALWPFNPNFPEPFSFPALRTLEWLVLALWAVCKGDTANIRGADQIRAGACIKWQWMWGEIVVRNNWAKIRRSPLGSLRDSRHYTPKTPSEWVETLLDADKFWSDVNGWALECLEKEFRILHPEGAPLLTYAMHGTAEHCEHLCRRFYAYQQARYRYHEHLLEKRCERCFGRERAYPLDTPNQARASLIAWLSVQRGYAKHPLVRKLRWANRTKQSSVWRAFDAECKHPSNSHYRITRSSPSKPDEMGWLILAWPIWNFKGWRWAQIGNALIRKFRVVDKKGKAIDFLKTRRDRMFKIVRSNLDENSSMPAEDFLTLYGKHLLSRTNKETEWQRLARKRSDDKAIEQLAIRAVGQLEILPRPKGRAKDENPPLWDFAQRIFV